MRHSSDGCKSSYDIVRQEKGIEYKKNVWVNTFGSEFYDPNYSYSNIIKTIKDKIMHGYTPEKYGGASKTSASKLIKQVEDNGYRLDIEFLESLDNEKKYLLSKLFINGIKENFGLDSFFKKELNSLGNPLHDGDSINRFVNKGTKDFLIFQKHAIFIWMIYWCRYDCKSKLINHKGIKDDLDFEDGYGWFNSNYFIHAYNFLLIDNKNRDLAGEYKFKLDPEKYKLRQPDKFFFDVLAEYNLLKNLDGDVNTVNVGKDLGEDFSLKAFYGSDDLGAGYESKYGSYGLDKNGNEISDESDLCTTGLKIKLDESGVPYTFLDRDSCYDSEGNLIDTSGKGYRVYLDSPSGVSLFYKNEPVAVISFFIRNGTELFINQIQRVSYEKYDRYGRCIGKNHLENLGKINRKKILYEAVESLVPKYGISRIVIQGGENNKWTKEYDTGTKTIYYEKYFGSRDAYLDENKGKKVHLKKEIAKQIYDELAKDLGFVPDDKGNYYKTMNSRE